MFPYQVRAEVVQVSGLAMSRFYDDMKSREEARARAEKRKEKLSTYFYDLSKLSFGGSVFAAVFAWINDVENYWYVVVLVVGILVTIIFAMFANKLLK